MHEALVDPDSQYITRGRYYERLTPFLAHFRRDRIAVVAREELLGERRRTLRSLFAFLGVDDGFWSSDLRRLWHQSKGDAPVVDERVRAQLIDAFRDDADRLRGFAGRDFPGWTV